MFETRPETNPNRIINWPTHSNPEKGPNPNLQQNPNFAPRIREATTPHVSHFPNFSLLIRIYQLNFFLYKSINLLLFYLINNHFFIHLHPLYEILCFGERSQRNYERMPNQSVLMDAQLRFFTVVSAFSR